MAKLRHRLPSHGTVAAYLALFIALGTGGAYAADKIGSKDIAKKAVKSKHIKNKGVKGKDLARRAVKTKNLGRKAVKGNKVAAGTLLSEHFADGQLPQGEQGPQGPQGPKGDKGEPATHLWAVVNPDGSSPSNSGVTSASRLTPTSPQYNVRFNRNISNCTAVATLGGNPTYNFGTQGEITVNVGQNNNPDLVAVVQKKSDGTNEGNKPFHLAVFCPN